MDNGNGIQNSDVATLSLLGSGLYGGYGYGNYGGFAHDGSVVVAKQEANRDIFKGEAQRVVDNQKAADDRARDSLAFMSSSDREFRNAERLNIISRDLNFQFNQIDRRFSDLALANAECCCTLKAGQAEIKAKLDQQEAIRVATEQAIANTKLDAILAAHQNS